jgi:hypothetical protein
MHTLIKIIILIILLSAALNSHAQTGGDKYKNMYEITRDELYLTYLRLDSSRSILNVLSKQADNLKNENFYKDSIINNLKLVQNNSEQEFSLLKNELAKQKETKFFEFKGFYAGISAYYRFDDSVLTKETILNGLKYDLTGTAKLSINGVIEFQGGISIPLRNEKFIIKISAEYKLF